MEPRIRIQALALARRGDEILVERGRDEVKDETFFRLLGGTVEFGESGADSLRRELREELGAEAGIGELLATIENRFTYEGNRQHELCLVYTCTLSDELSALDAWEATENTARGPVTHFVSWRPVDSFGSGRHILYPEQLLELLK